MDENKCKLYGIVEAIETMKKKKAKQGGVGNVKSSQGIGHSHVWGNCHAYRAAGMGKGNRPETELCGGVWGIRRQRAGLELREGG